jgi:hypothetical protein
MPEIIAPDVTSARTRLANCLLAVALAPTICVMGCATAPVASHGMDQIPAYDASYYGRPDFKAEYARASCKQSILLTNYRL